MRRCVYVCACYYMYMCVPECMYVCTYKCEYVYICECLYMCVFMCTPVYMGLCGCMSLNVEVPVYMCVCMFVCAGSPGKPKRGRAQGARQQGPYTGTAAPSTSAGPQRRPPLTVPQARSSSFKNSQAPGKQAHWTTGDTLWLGLRGRELAPGPRV